MSAAHGTVAVATMAVELFEAAQGYLEARDELHAAQDAYDQANGDDALEPAVTAAEEREFLALARLRAKVAAW